MDTTNEEINAISLFAGYGGLDIGVKAAIPNLRIIAYVEREAHAVALLAQKIKDGVLDEAPIWPDVTSLPAEEFRGKVHLVIAGYPCQDFSCAGKRAGLGGDRGKMWGFTRAVLNGCDAPAFIGENVLGHLSLGFDTVVSDLAEDGYHVEAGICSAGAVGLPHLRKRIFSFAIKTDVREWGIREPDELISALRKSNKGHELRHAASERLEGAAREELQGGVDGLARDDRTGMVGEQSGESCAGGSEERDGARGANGDVSGLRGDSAGNVANHESSGWIGSDRELGGSDERRISEHEGQVGTDFRGNAGASGGSNGQEGELVNAVRGGSSERASGQMGGETKEEGGGGDQPAQEAGHPSETSGETEFALTLARLYDEGFPSTLFGEDGKSYIDFSKDVGDPKYNGSFAKQELRSDEGDGSTRGEEKQGETIKPERTDRPVDVPSVRRREERSELGDPEHDGSSPPEGGGSSGEEQEEGRVQELKGGCEFYPVRAPARPGEDQYDWEDPRVTEASSQPFMGGIPNDVAENLHLNQIRQDRLRLCGNGVVWLSAGRAVSEIYVKHRKWLTKFLNSE